MNIFTHDDSEYFTADAPRRPLVFSPSFVNLEEQRNAQRSHWNMALDMIGALLAGGVAGSVGFFCVAYLMR